MINPWNPLLSGPVRITEPPPETRHIHRMEDSEPEPEKPLWGLTKGQMHILDTIVQEGNIRAAAAKLNVSSSTVEEQLRRARKRMGVETNIEAVIAWDRAKRL